MLKVLHALGSALVLVQGVRAVVPRWGICGGEAFNGNDTTCEAGSSCVVLNRFWFQCLPSTPSTTTAITLSTPAPRGIFTVKASTNTTLNGKFTSHPGKKYWGVILPPSTLNSSPGNTSSIVKTEFGAITPDNPMLWDATEPTRGTFIFGSSDLMVNWAVSNGKLIRGYTLVWHSRLPSWLSYINDKDSLTSVIQTHVTTVANRYSGKLVVWIHKWDVCNEVLNEDGSFRNSLFYSVLGESYITIAYQAARAADSKAKLYINDYNLASINAKTQAMVKLVGRINSPTKLIDGIGTETHISAAKAGGIQAALTVLASTGLEVAITALDIANASPDDYATVVKACLATPACVSITSESLGSLFNSNNQPTAAYKAILAIL